VSELNAIIFTWVTAAISFNGIISVATAFVFTLFVATPFVVMLCVVMRCYALLCHKSPKTNGYKMLAKTANTKILAIHVNRVLFVALLIIVGSG